METGDTPSWGRGRARLRPSPIGVKEAPASELGSGGRAGRGARGAGRRRRGERRGARGARGAGRSEAGGGTAGRGEDTGASGEARLCPRSARVFLLCFLQLAT